MAPDQPTRERLLRAGLELVAEAGVDAVSHRAIEQRAGVARGSTRYHFGTVEGFLTALIGHLADRDRAIVARALAGLGTAAAGGGTPDAEALRAGVEAIAAGVIADRDAAVARFELYLYASRRPALAAVLRGWSEGFRSFGAAVLADRGVADPERTAALLSASLDGLTLHAATTGDPAILAAGPAWYAGLVLDHLP